jgi:uncharacterized protein YhhL (DUF1145 family)
MVAKIFLGGVWIWGAASAFGSAGVPGARLGRIVFWLLVVVHTIECVVYLPTLERAGGSLTWHLVQTFLFGIAHLREIAPSAG